MTDLIQVDRAGLPTAEAAANALQEAFEAIARELFAPRPWDGDAPDFESQRRRLAPRKVLITAHSLADKKVIVPARQWERFELEMSLRQLEMMVLALRTPSLAAATSVRVSPQQGGVDVSGDGPDGPWVLEVFGGGDVSNNRKLAKDATALLTIGEGTLKLFACRRSALGGKRPKHAGDAMLTVVHDEGAEENDVVMFRVEKRQPT